MEMDVSLIIVKDNKKLSLKGLTENKMQKVKLKIIIKDLSGRKIIKTKKFNSSRYALVLSEDKKIFFSKI